jgi:hypothetical protein
MVGVAMAAEGAVVGVDAPETCEVQAAATDNNITSNRVYDRLGFNPFSFQFPL